MDDELHYGDWYFYNKYGMSKEAALCKCGSGTIFGNERDALGVARSKDADAYVVDTDRTAKGYVHLSYHHPWCPMHSLENWEQEMWQKKNKWEAYYGKSLYSEPKRLKSRLKSLSEMKDKYPSCFPQNLSRKA